MELNIHLSDINKPYRGWKLTHFEGGLHVPFMAKWPNKIETVNRINAPIHANDILPTFAAAAGAELPEDRIIDGVNLLPFYKITIQTCHMKHYIGYKADFKLFFMKLKPLLITELVKTGCLMLRVTS